MSALFIDPLDAEPQLSDWPLVYAEWVAENSESPVNDKEELLDLLCQEHEDMRFGQYIDLNLQQGFHLQPGNGLVTKKQGVDSGFVIGALSGLGITIDRNDFLDWSSSEAEQHYVRDGCAKLAWVLGKATGPWFLTADFHEGKRDDWYWLVLRFLSEADEAAFLAAFPEAAA